MSAVRAALWHQRLSPLNRLLLPCGGLLLSLYLCLLLMLGLPLLFNGRCDLALPLLSLLLSLDCRSLCCRVGLCDCRLLCSCKLLGFRRVVMKAFLHRFWKFDEIDFRD